MSNNESHTFAVGEKVQLLGTEIVGEIVGVSDGVYEISYVDGDGIQHTNSFDGLQIAYPAADVSAPEAEGSVVVEAGGAQEGDQVKTDEAPAELSDAPVVA